MPPRTHAARALVAGLAIVLLAAPAPGAAATSAELERARDRIDSTSAELARARTAAERLGGAERRELERLERRLERQKQALIRLEAGLEARVQAGDDDPGGDAGAAPPDAPAPAADADGPLVVLGDAPRTTPGDDGPARPTVVPLPDERRPVVSGDAAALAAQIDGYLASKASPLTGLGAVFVTESRAAGVDPLFLVAIAGAETSFGTYGPSQAIHNPFGMGPGIVYPSWSDAIRGAARNLGGRLYAGAGLATIPAIQARWAPNGASNDPTGLNSHWTRNVSTYLAELGGDPAAVVVRVTASAPPPAPTPAAAGPAGAPVVVPEVPVIAPAEPVLGASGRGEAAAAAALEQLGVASVAGGDSPRRGFDAAGLVAWAYAEQGVRLPRGVVAQSRVGEAIAPRELQAGDAVFFSDPSGLVEHVGLYLGDGQFVHAAGAGDVVAIASLYEPFHAEAYAGARRY